MLLCVLVCLLLLFSVGVCDVCLVLLFMVLLCVVVWYVWSGVVVQYLRVCV